MLELSLIGPKLNTLLSFFTTSGPLGSKAQYAAVLFNISGPLWPKLNTLLYFFLSWTCVNNDSIMKYKGLLQI
jgi:hypothetical protein